MSVRVALCLVLVLPWGQTLLLRVSGAVLVSLLIAKTPRICKLTPTKSHRWGNGVLGFRTVVPFGRFILGSTWGRRMWNVTSRTVPNCGVRKRNPQPSTLPVAIHSLPVRCRVPEVQLQHPSFLLPSGTVRNGFNMDGSEYPWDPVNTRA